MLFNSFEFLLFLPVVFLIHWQLIGTLRGRNMFLIAASYMFYGWWDYRFLFLIFATTVMSYASGWLIDRYGVRSGRSRLVLWVNVAVNLGILSVYKYFNFFAASFASVMRSIGWEVDSVTLDLILPVGISFYTFQALGYCIDVYRGDIRGTKDFAAFTAFISFFPQLVAGPIERSTNLLPQFMRNRHFDYAYAVSGMKLILWGLFKKMVVADNAAAVVNPLFASFDTQGTVNLWLGAVLFSFQIYCDFSGYSDIAIGTGRLFGITLRRNFNKPYLAKGIGDFWRRWHISLTSWFRDYVYIPLGGNRRGTSRTVGNTMIVYITSGLWHGANLTFIVWGAYHGLMSLPRIIRRGYAKARGIDPDRLQQQPGLLGSTLLLGSTFFIVMIGWIFFRADHVSEALRYIGRMFVWTPGPVTGKTAMAWVVVLMLVEVLTRHQESPFDFSRGVMSHSRALRWAAYLCVFIVTLIFAGVPADFIYFQF